MQQHEQLVSIEKSSDEHLEEGGSGIAGGSLGIEIHSS
jgi:hypothetical protein